MNKVDKILSMVDLFPGDTIDDKKQGKKNLLSIIGDILPSHLQTQSAKARYCKMFEEVVNSLIASPFVTNKSGILKTVFQSAKFGLYPDPAMGLIYFVPYKGNITYQLGYKGMIQLAKNSGLVKSVVSGLVYDKEVSEGNWYYYEDELGQHFKHVPDMSRDKGLLYCGWSCITMNDGFREIHVMDAHRIDDIKKIVLSRTPKSPWADPLYLPEMQKKTVIRRHMKTQTLSPEIAIVIDHEESVERGELPTASDNDISSVIDEIINTTANSSEPNTKSEIDVQPITDTNKLPLPY